MSLFNRLKYEAMLEGSYDKKQERVLLDAAKALEAADAMAEALERLERNFHLMLRGSPVRDVDETQAEVKQALAAYRATQKDD